MSMESLVQNERSLSKLKYLLLTDYELFAIDRIRNPVCYTEEKHELLDNSTDFKEFMNSQENENEENEIAEDNKVYEYSDDTIRTELNSRHFMNKIIKCLE
jgi:protein associated with RNAse G/E